VAGDEGPWEVAIGDVDTGLGLVVYVGESLQADGPPEQGAVPERVGLDVVDEYSMPISSRKTVAGPWECQWMRTSGTHWLMEVRRKVHWFWSGALRVWTLQTEPE
jgi:hypothetical protein